MGKLENEVKILEVDPAEVERRIQELGGKLVRSGIQKIYVYDLMDISSRYADCLHGLENVKYNYQYDVVRGKLRGLLNEVDNLVSDTERQIIQARFAASNLVAMLDRTPSEDLLSTFGTDELKSFIGGFKINPDKWIRLRETDGVTTLTVKHKLDPKAQRAKGEGFQKTLETEMVVPSLEAGKDLLEQLGYQHRNYQEKKRTTYELFGVEIDIDTWPRIPSYVEIEHDSITYINKLAIALGLANKEMVSCNPEAVLRKYGIDIFEYRNFLFGEEDKAIKEIKGARVSSDGRDNI